MAEPIGITKEKLSELREQGLTIDQCAEHYGCSRRTINTYIKRFGLQKNRLHDFDTDELVRLYKEEGLTVQQIADKYGVYYDTIYQRIKDVADMRPVARRPGTFTGPDCPIWKGGIRVINGYIRIQWHDGEEGLHRIIARDVMGYDLGPDDVVHHMDCNKANNDPTNLLVCTHSEHMKLHAEMRRNPDVDQRKWLEEYRAQQSQAA